MIYDPGVASTTAYSLWESTNFYTTTSCSDIGYYDYGTTTSTNYPLRLKKTVDGYVYSIYRSKTDVTTDTYINWYLTNVGDYQTKLSPGDKLRSIIQARQAPAFLRARQALPMPYDTREARARETLLRVLGEDKYRRFVRNGFISVRGKSGKVYQIFPGHGFTKVYHHGVLLEKLCVVLSGSFPPSDSVIMRYLLILNDEEEFRRMANKHVAGTRSIISAKTVDNRPLPDIYKEFRLKVGMAA